MTKQTCQHCGSTECDQCTDLGDDIALLCAELNRAYAMAHGIDMHEATVEDMWRESIDPRRDDI